jgi:hypothetical protein
MGKGRENRPMLIKFPTFGRKQFYTIKKKLGYKYQCGCITSAQKQEKSRD